MKYTIKDIAKMAGVSPSTVSKILNNYHDIGEDTKKAVLEVMEKTGYRPSYSAKALATKKSNIIGVIYAGKINADFNHPFFVDVINAFKKNIGEFGYDLLFFSNEKFASSKGDYLSRCRHYQIDGCIIINGDDIEASIDELDHSEIPCIGVDLPLSGKTSGYVTTDNYQVSAKVVEHFYLLGCREIAYIAGNPKSVVSNLRTEGLERAMQKFGIPFREEWVVHGDYFEESGYEAMKKLLSHGEVPQALFAASDLMALGAIRAIKEEGLRIPEDIAVVGCDDIDAARLVDPPLSTVKQDKEKIGKLAAYMLRDLMDKRTDSCSILVEPELIVRQSCGAKSRDGSNRVPVRQTGP
ncbi:LacI family transcriptional regulator [Desmospora profundinema]|uniref:LacI family transcriptional regulator n=2 Tax=Desmospora profundinema TaxID=1571184 RepID=A0ABU1IPQ6_9BACL|nr:LacI family transcriptional regulator [Desmospora profundinema]